VAVAARTALFVQVEDAPWGTAIRGRNGGRAQSPTAMPGCAKGPPQDQILDIVCEYQAVVDGGKRGRAPVEHGAGVRVLALNRAGRAPPIPGFLPPDRDPKRP